MKKILHILITINTQLCIGQSNILSKHFTPNDGLASSETYCLQLDAFGYLWIGTDRGLNKFDGKTFEIYTTANGLGTNFVDKLFINPNNQQLWARCLDKKLYYLENEQFKPYTHNSALQAILKINGDDLQNVTFKNNEVQKIYTKRNGVLQVQNNTLTKIEQKNYYQNHLCIDSITNAPSVYYNNYDSNSLYYDGVKIKLGKIINTFDRRVLFIKRKNGQLIVVINEWIFEIKNGTLLQKIKLAKPVLSIYEDLTNHLWISCNTANGVFRYPPNAFPSNTNYEILFPNVLVSCVLQDAEKNFWMCTHDDGIYFIPNVSIKQINVPIIEAEKEIINKIESSEKGILFAGTNKAKIYYLHNKNWTTINIKQYAKDLRKYLSQFETVTNCNSLYYDDKANKIYFALPHTGSINLTTNQQENNSYGIGYDIRKINSSTLVTSSQNGIKVNSSVDSSKYYSIESDERTYTSIQFKNKIWVGGETGLYTVNNDQNSNINGLSRTNVFNKNTRITDLEVYDKEIMICSTLGDGIFITDGITSKFINLNPLTLTNHKGYNMINDIELNNDTLFAATQNGVVWFSVMQPVPELHYISSKTGLMLNDIKSITFNNNHLYVLNQNKIIAINFDELNKEIRDVDVFIKNIFINDSSYTNFTNIILGAEKDRLKISFGSISFKSGDQIYYQYRLSNTKTDFDTTWQITQNKELEYFSLKPGMYTLEVRAINENNFPSAIVKKLSFEVKAPFYKKNWFIVGLVLLLVALMFLLNQLRLKRVEKRNTLQEQLLKYEQQALAAQINPHFIFNSINSIQSFILKKDERQTLKYLTKFSRLMRLSLDNSRAKWVIPNDELDLIKVYLELEKLRFGDKFDYEINIDPVLNSHKFLIAPMLAQPFIENAIKHGVNNLVNKKGLIIVNVTLLLPQKNVLIEIDDNGIGRAMAKNKVSELTKNHLSAGVDITISRIKILCYESKRAFYFHITDKPNNGGTTVSFYLPHKVNPNHKI